MAADGTILRRPLYRIERECTETSARSRVLAQHRPEQTRRESGLAIAAPGGFQCRAPTRLVIGVMVELPRCHDHSDPMRSDLPLDLVADDAFVLGHCTIGNRHPRHRVSPQAEYVNGVALLAAAKSLEDVDREIVRICGPTVGHGQEADIDLPTDEVGHEPTEHDRLVVGMRCDDERGDVGRHPA
jgi:hypothetical protein